MTLRTNITQSDATFVVSALVVSVVWMLGHWSEQAYWGGLACTLITAYVLLETNNRCQLLRVRSRMVSSSYLFLIGALPSLHQLTTAHVVGLSVAWANLILFSAYQQHEPVGRMYYGYVLLGAGICAYPPLLLAVPLLWLSCAVHLRTLTLRSWTASVLGLITPHIYLGILMLMDVGITPEHWTRYLSLQLPTLPSPATAAMLGVAALYTIWSLVHFRATAYRDVMRTRMSYNVLRTELYAALLLLLLWWDTLPQVMMLTLAASAPYVAHYFALSEGRWHNRWCWLAVWLTLALGVINYLDLWNILLTF